MSSSPDSIQDAKTRERDDHQAGQGLHRRQLKAARRAALGAYVPDSAEAIAARRRAYGSQDQEIGDPLPVWYVARSGHRCVFGR